MTMEQEMAQQMQRITRCTGCVRAIRENHGAPVPGCQCWRYADEIYAALCIMPTDAKVSLADLLLDGTMYHVASNHA